MTRAAKNSGDNFPTLQPSELTRESDVSFPRPSVSSCPVCEREGGGGTRSWVGNNEMMTLYARATDSPGTNETMTLAMLANCDTCSSRWLNRAHRASRVESTWDKLKLWRQVPFY